MPYTFLEDIATADVAFAVTAPSREELFAEAAAALMHVMVDNPEAVEQKEQIAISLTADALDLLLFSLLQELIFYKDARRLLLWVKTVAIDEAGDEFTLNAVVSGEYIDPLRHHLSVDVKAVTLHRFRVEETSEGWEATVVVDV